MRKILYIFALVICVLLNASADVYRLKVKDELAQKDEFWVENGTPTEMQTDSCMHFVSTTKPAEGTPSADSNKIYFKKKTSTNSGGEVVIYLKGITGQEDRRAIAKHQFENILKCGLLTESKNAFNDKIFAQQFNGTKWQMPGIAVKVSPNIEEYEFPVVYSMKISKPRQCNATHFFQEADWNNLLQGNQQIKTFGNYEHTERQLFYSIVHGGTELAELDVIAPLTTVTTPQIQKQLSDGDTFFIWTMGNPCITQDYWTDNGGYCCTYWYKSIIPRLLPTGSKVFVYFDDNHKEVSINQITQTVGYIDVRFTDENQEHTKCNNLVELLADATHNGTAENMLKIICGRNSCCLTLRRDAIRILNNWTRGETWLIEYCDHLTD